MKQAPKAYFDNLNNFLKKFLKRKDDTTLFKPNIFLCAGFFYKFGATNESLCKDIFNMMYIKLERSMMGDLWYSFGL